MGMIVVPPYKVVGGTNELIFVTHLEQELAPGFPPGRTF